jgi:hypothetical protein
MNGSASQTLDIAKPSRDQRERSADFLQPREQAVSHGNELTETASAKAISSIR